MLSRLNAKCCLVDYVPNAIDNWYMRKNAKLPKALGKKIQKKRYEMGFTQEELGYKVGISRAYMGYIEKGRYAPSLEVLEKIAKALKTSLNKFF